MRRISSTWRRETLGEREGDPLEANPIRRREGGVEPLGENPIHFGAEPILLGIWCCEGDLLDVNRIWGCECDSRENSSVYEKGIPVNGALDCG